MVSSSTDYRRTHELPSLDKIIDVVTEYYKVDRKTLLKVRRGQTNVPKMLAIYACRKLSGETISNIAEKFQLNSHSAISKSVRLIAHHMLVDRKLMRDYKRISRHINS